MSIVFLRKNIERLNRALFSGAITTEEAARICEYANSKSFLAAYRQVAGKPLSKAILDEYLSGMNERLTTAIDEQKGGPSENTEIVGYFALTGSAWDLLANSIRQQNPNLVLDKLKFHGIIYANNYCRVVVTGPTLAVKGVVPVLGFTAGCDLRTVSGYMSLTLSDLSNLELSALMRGK